jgi:hypothetical protein
MEEPEEYSYYSEEPAENTTAASGSVPAMAAPETAETAEAPDREGAQSVASSSPAPSSPQDLPKGELVSELRRRRPLNQWVPQDVQESFPELQEGVASFRAKAASRPRPPTPIPRGVQQLEADQTIVRVLVDFHNFLDIGPHHTVPDYFAPVMVRMLEKNCRLIVCSFVGWQSDDCVEAAEATHTLLYAALSHAPP